MNDSMLTRKLAVILFVLIAALTSFIGWAGEYRSCVRQGDVRDSSRLVASTAAQARRADADKPTTTPAERANYLRLARIYERAAAEAAPLQCSKLLPDAAS